MATELKKLAADLAGLATVLPSHRWRRLITNQGPDGWGVFILASSGVRGEPGPTPEQLEALARLSELLPTMIAMIKEFPDGD